MSTESTVREIDLLIQQGNFQAAKQRAARIHTPDVSNEERSDLEQLNRALKADSVIIGAILILAMVWIGVSFSAV